LKNIPNNIDRALNKN